MPDDTEKSADSKPEKQDTATDGQLKVDENLKEDLKKAKSSLWKKILIWGGGILAVIGAIIGIVYLLKGKGPVKGTKEAVQKAKANVAKADMEEKIKVAKAKQAEKAVIDKLEEIKEIENEVEQLEELNKLL